MRRRRRKQLSDIGPNTRQLETIRDGIRGLRTALDRGACKDAAFLLKLTEREMKRLKYPAKSERDFLDDEKLRLKKACKMG